VSLNWSAVQHRYTKGTVNNSVFQYETALRYNF
jgi:hypothetical protein